MYSFDTTSPFTLYPFHSSQSELIWILFEQLVHLSDPDRICRIQRCVFLFSIKINNHFLFISAQSHYVFLICLTIPFLGGNKRQYCSLFMGLQMLHSFCGFLNLRIFLGCLECLDQFPSLFRLQEHLCQKRRALP